jgi:hypothetical protein
MLGSHEAMLCKKGIDCRRGAVKLNEVAEEYRGRIAER